MLRKSITEQKRSHTSYNHKYVIGDINAYVKFLKTWYQESEEPIVSMNY